MVTDRHLQVGWSNLENNRNGAHLLVFARPTARGHHCINLKPIGLHNFAKAWVKPPIAELTLHGPEADLDGCSYIFLNRWW